MTNYMILLALFSIPVVMTSHAWTQTDEAKPVLPFSAAREAGQTLYVAGQVAIDENGAEIKTSVAAETRQVMANIGAVLKRHGYDFADVVSATVYLRDLADYGEMNVAYAAHFADGKFPARACVGGVDLVRGFRVEISCIAVKQ